MVEHLKSNLMSRTLTNVLPCIAKLSSIPWSQVSQVSNAVSDFFHCIWSIYLERGKKFKFGGRPPQTHILNIYFFEEEICRHNIYCEYKTTENISNKTSKLPHLKSWLISLWQNCGKLEWPTFNIYINIFIKNVLNSTWNCQS